MAWAQDRCICLRKTEFSETSQIITLFARTFGIVRLIAKGAHRRTKAGASKFDGGVDFLDAGDAVFSHDPARDLPPLTEWHLTEGHQALRQTFRGICLGLYAAELIDRLIEEHDPHPDLYDRLAATLPLLAGKGREEVFLAYQLDVLRSAGYLPELRLCTACGEIVDGRGGAWFSPASGGIVCRNCELSVHDRIPFDPRLLGVLQMVLKLPRQGGAVQRLPQLTRHQTDPINRLLATHIEQTLQRRLRMPRWVVGR